MKVTITEMDQCLWMRDGSTGEGVASKGYIKDGTQEKIIAALEEALHQAKSELLCWND